MVALKKQVGRLTYQKEELSSKVEALHEEERRLEQGSGVKDAAFKLGYQAEGEQVYYFEDGQKPETEKPNRTVVTDSITYVHLPLWGTFLAALGISVLFMLWYRFKVGKKDAEG